MMLVNVDSKGDDKFSKAIRDIKMVSISVCGSMAVGYIASRYGALIR